MSLRIIWYSAFTATTLVLTEFSLTHRCREHCQFGLEHRWHEAIRKAFITTDPPIVLPHYLYTNQQQKLDHRIIRQKLPGSPLHLATDPIEGQAVVHEHRRHLTIELRSACFLAYCTSFGEAFIFCSCRSHTDVRRACTLTQVQSGSSYDQYSSFRGSQLAPLVQYDSTWNCQFVNNTFYPTSSSVSLFATFYRWALLLCTPGQTRILTSRSSLKDAQKLPLWIIEGKEGRGGVIEHLIQGLKRILIAACTSTHVHSSLDHPLSNEVCPAPSPYNEIMCRCNYAYASMYLNMSFDPQTFQISYGYSQILLQGSAKVDWSAGSLSGSIYISIQNLGNISDTVSIQPSGCVNDNSTLIFALSPRQTIGPISSSRFAFLAGLQTS